MKKEIKRTTGEVLGGYTLLEQTYDSKTRSVEFLVYDGNKVTRHNEFSENGVMYKPYKPTNILISNAIVLLPSGANKYGDVKSLESEIKRFIHKYVDLKADFEDICVRYVLLSWVYDGFDQLGYLRRVGDLGTGKSRFLKVVGSICYKPIFASGSSSTAAIFHMLDKLKGTLILDEADFRYSDEKADLTKVLNNGFMKGFPVLRCATSKDKEFDPVGYQVFGCKIVASRKSFNDPALESRFITEEVRYAPLRADIPIELPHTFESEALALRNKLLRYRFDMFKEISLFRKDIELQGAEPRVSQILKPLLQISSDSDFELIIRKVAKKLSRSIQDDRYNSIECHTLLAINYLRAQGESEISIGRIADHIFAQYSEFHKRPITARWIGHVISSSLGLKTVKKCGKFHLSNDLEDQLSAINSRYGISS